MAWLAVGVLVERPNLDVAESDRACPVLKRERAAAKLIVGRVDGLGAVQDDDEPRCLGRDFVGVPLTPAVDHRARCGQVHDPAGPVRLIGPGIVDIDLIAVSISDVLRVGAADEHTAVGGLIDPEFQRQFEITVGLLRDEKPAAVIC